VPYVIIAKVEPKTEPLIAGRICRARLVGSHSGQTVYMPSREPSVGAIVFSPGAMTKGLTFAPTYDVVSVSGGPIAELSWGPYSDLSAIKNAIEGLTNEICRIMVSA